MCVVLESSPVTDYRPQLIVRYEGRGKREEERVFKLSIFTVLECCHGWLEN